MKREAWIYLPLTAFFFLMTVVYFFLGRVDIRPNRWRQPGRKTTQIEWAVGRARPERPDAVHDLHSSS